MKQANWYDARIWLVYTAAGFLGPVLIGVFVGYASGVAVTMEWIAGRGQFAISSAGLLMTTYYFLARPGSLFRLPHAEWFMLFSIAGLVAGIVFFVLATLTLSGIDIDSRFYQVPSIGLFLLALVVAFIAVGFDKTREIETPGLLEDGNRAERDKLAEGFEATFKKAD